LPADYRDKWDSHHVRMPCSRRNMSSATQSWRWLKIRQALSPHNGFRDTGALIDAIKGYMGKPKQNNPKKWTFRALKSLVDEYYGPREKARFFQETLPFIIESALALPHRCPEPISLLRAGRTAGVNLTSLQIVSLLANGFLCTFPEDTRAQAAAERKFPRFNFYMLFEAPEKRWNPKANPVKQHIQKLLCIIHYFERQAARSDAELARSIVTFHRRSHEHGRSWERSTTRIGSVTLQVDAQGRIEDVDPTGADVWEADFANRVIGGGVLGSGCVQEEIRFLLSPELIASRLLTERMGDLESVLITGSERFSKYTGYADTFEFGGDFVDEAIKDVVGTADATAGALSAAEFRRKTTVVAMDALYFRNEQRPRRVSVPSHVDSAGTRQGLGGLSTPRRRRRRRR
jgi:poly(ADP-ribose) glycohydrolase